MNTIAEINNKAESMLKEYGFYEAANVCLTLSANDSFYAEVYPAIFRIFREWQGI